VVTKRRGERGAPLCGKGQGIARDTRRRRRSERGARGKKKGKERARRENNTTKESVYVKTARKGWSMSKARRKEATEKRQVGDGD